MNKTPKFAQIPFVLVCRFGELGKNEIIVFCVLLGYRNHRTGQCNPKQMNIAQETNLYKTRISEALSGLVRKGWIDIPEAGQFSFPLLSQKVTESVTYFDPEMSETEVTKSVTFDDRKTGDGVTEFVTFEEKEAGDRVTESVTSKAEETMGQVTESVTPSYEIRNLEVTESVTRVTKSVTPYIRKNIQRTYKRNREGNRGLTSLNDGENKSDKAPPVSEPVQKFFEAEKSREENDQILPNSALRIYGEIFAIALTKKQTEYFSERLREVNETLWRQNLLEWDIHPRWQKDNITGMIDRYFKQLKRSEENEDGTNQKLSEREQRLFNSRKGARERYERAQRIIKAEQEISRIDGMDVVLGTG